MSYRSLVVAPILILAAPALAGEDVRFVETPAWVEPLYDGGIAESRDNVPLYDRQIRFEDGVVTRYTDIAYRLDTTQALQQMGTIQLSWLPDKGDLAVHRLEILRDGAVIDLLAQGLRPEILRRERELERRSVNGALTAAFAVPGLELGDVLRVTSSTSLRDQALAGAMQAAEPILAEPTKVGTGRLRLSWPDTVPMQWKTLGDVKQPESWSEGGFAVLDLLKRSRFGFGALCIFLYVGAEVSIGSIIINYLAEDRVLGQPESVIGWMISLYWGGAMVGRFIGSYFLRLFSPGKILAFNATGSILLILISANSSGTLAAYSLLAVGLMNSIMFPTIFSLACEKLGSRAADGSGIINVAIFGGAVVPLLFGVLADTTGSLPLALTLPAICYAIIASFGLFARKPATA